MDPRVAAMPIESELKDVPDNVGLDQFSANDARHRAQNNFHSQLRRWKKLVDDGQGFMWKGNNDHILTPEEYSAYREAAMKIVYGQDKKGEKKETGLDEELQNPNIKSSLIAIAQTRRITANTPEERFIQKLVDNYTAVYMKTLYDMRELEGDFHYIVNRLKEGWEQTAPTKTSVANISPEVPENAPLQKREPQIAQSALPIPAVPQKISLAMVTNADLMLVPNHLLMAQENIFYARERGRNEYRIQLAGIKNSIQKGEFSLARNGENSPKTLEEFKKFEDAANLILFGEDNKSGIDARLNTPNIKQALAVIKKAREIGPNAPNELTQYLISAYLSGYGQALSEPDREPMFNAVVERLHEDWHQFASPIISKEDIPSNATIQKEHIVLARQDGDTQFERQIEKYRQLIETNQFKEFPQLSTEEFDEYVKSARKLLYGKDGHSGIAIALNTNNVRKIITALENQGDLPLSVEHKMVHRMVLNYIDSYVEELIKLDRDSPYNYLLRKSSAPTVPTMIENGTLKNVPSTMLVRDKSLKAAMETGEESFKKKLQTDKNRMERGEFHIMQGGELHQITLQEFEQYALLADKMIHGTDGKGGLTEKLQNTNIKRILIEIQRFNNGRAHPVVKRMVSGYVKGFASKLRESESNFSYVEDHLNDNWLNL